jgi:aryl-alcohol dehydrogenase-like predicted oxidoreductase
LRQCPPKIHFSVHNCSRILAVLDSTYVVLICRGRRPGPRTTHRHRPPAPGAEQPRHRHRTGTAPPRHRTGASHAPAGCAAALGRWCLASFLSQRMPVAEVIGKRQLFYPEGPLVSEIGFGAWPIGGAFGVVERTDGIHTVQAAVRLGASFIDTADYYENAPAYGNRTNSQGGSETVIGLALSADAGLAAQAFVTTKVSQQPHTREQIHTKCAESAKNLQMGTIPLLQLHSYDESTPAEERMGALQELQAEGKILYIGLNNTTREQLEEAWSTGVRFHTLQVRYNMFSRRYVEDQIFPWCRAHGVGVLAHSVLGKGLLGGRYSSGHQWAEDDERSSMVDFHGERFAQFCAAVEQLKAVAARHGATMAELAVGWVLRRPEVSGNNPLPRIERAVCMRCRANVCMRCRANVRLSHGYAISVVCVSVALVGGKSPSQVEQNRRFVTGLSECDLGEISAILDQAPEVSWEITNGGADTSDNNEARAAVVRRAFPSFTRSVLTDIYLCHPCSCQKY